MATSDQVKGLVRSHAKGDDPQFYAIAMQVAARAARAGHAKFAQELRTLVNEFRAQQADSARMAPVIAVTQPKGELGSLLRVSYPQARLNDLVYADELRARVDNVLTEQRQRHTLTRHGLCPARRLLLTGPPGTGKTSTAHVIAGELGVPLFVVRLDAVITKYLGETAAKLRLIFDALAETRGVYLFDEVDALAGDRSASNDIGEVRRILNSFLQFLEEDPSDSVVVAATNHPTLLDAAMFRRFDTVLTFALPDVQAVPDIVRNRLATFDLALVSWSEVITAAAGLNQAEITTAAENAAKRGVLSGRPRILTGDLLAALAEWQRRGDHVSGSGGRG